MAYRFAVLDAAYGDVSACIACLVASAVGSGTPEVQLCLNLPGASGDYAPGEFYKRELPALLAALDRLDTPPDLIIIDGYVWLSADGRPGLGARLHDHLGGRIPVIGIAKTPFRGDDWSARVLRGMASRPLYVTSAGIEQAAAGDLVRAMHGPFRLPTLCQKADRLARDGLMMAPA